MSGSMITVVDDRYVPQSFMWRAPERGEVKDMVQRFRIEQNLTRRIVVKPFVVGFTQQRINSMSPMEFSEKHGILLMRLQDLNEESLLLVIAERLDLWCNYALSKAKDDPEEGLKDASKKVIMKSEIFKDVFERSSRLYCSDFLRGRRDIQDVRGKRVHPSHVVTQSLPPSIPQEEFAAAIPPRNRHVVGFLYHLILREDDPVLVLAKEFEDKRRSGYQDNGRPHGTVPVRISLDVLLICSWSLSRPS